MRGARTSGRFQTRRRPRNEDCPVLACDGMRVYRPMGIIIAVIAFLLLSGLRVAQEYQRGVIFRLGRFTGTRGPGLYWIIPLGIERSVMIDIRISTVSAEQQETDHAR